MLFVCLQHAFQYFLRRWNSLYNALFDKKSVLWLVEIFETLKLVSNDFDLIFLNILNSQPNEFFTNLIHVHVKQFLYEDILIGLSCPVVYLFRTTR